MKPTEVNVSLIPCQDGVFVWNARFHINGDFDFSGTDAEREDKYHRLEERIAKAIEGVTI
jgi:hypothetical protein